MCWRYVVLFGLALPACAAESLDAASNDEVAADEAAATNFPARVLAELQFSGGRQVQFVEVMPGQVALSEVGAGDPADAVLKHVAPGSLLEVYSSLTERGAAYDANAVERLAETQLRMDAASALGTARAAPALAEPTATHVAANADGIASQRQGLLINEKGSHPTFTDAEFDRVYCNAAELGYPDEHCFIRTTFADTGWSRETSWIRSIVVTTASQGSTTHNMRQFVCVATVPIIGTCLRNGWKTRLTQTIPPANYGMIVSDFKFTNFNASGTLFNMGEIGR